MGNNNKNLDILKRLLNRKNIGLFLLFLFLLGLTIYLQSFSNKIYLYAWETPQDFSFLADQDYSNKKIGVAYLAGEITLNNSGITFSERRNPLIIPKGIEVISVVRINNFASIQELETNKEKIVGFIINHCSKTRDCQLDVDARVSEYAYYEDVIGLIKKRSAKMRVSITALVSWCSKNSWINSLSIDYAVPMLYRMGDEGNSIKRGQMGKWFLSNSLCERNVSLSADEMDFDFNKYIKDKNIFLFNAETWTKQKLDGILKALVIK